MTTQLKKQLHAELASIYIILLLISPGIIMKIFCLLAAIKNFRAMFRVYVDDAKTSLKRKG